MSGFKIAHLNIRSLLGKIDQLSEDITKSGLDILTMSETWLNALHEDKLTSIDNYKFIRLDRQTLRTNGRVKTGGGLGIYCKHDIQIDSKIFQDLNISDSTIEVQWVVISKAYTKNILIGNVYRPPDGKLVDAFRQLSNQLSKIPKLDKYETVILGDFNADNLNGEKTPAQLIKKFASEHEYHQMITQPTRYSKKNKTTIDLIFTNMKHCTKSGTCNYNLSDHKMIYTVKKKIRTCKLTEVTTGRTYRNANPEIIMQAVQDHKPNMLELERDPNNCWDKLEEIITEIADKVSPLIEIRTRIKTAEFLNNDLIELQRDRDYFVNKADLTQDEGDRFIANCMIRKARKEITIAKANYYKRQAINNKHNPKRFWRKIKQIHQEQKEVINNIIDDITQTKIAEENLPEKINDYFVEIGPRLAKNIQTIPNNEKIYKAPINNKILNFRRVREGEVEDKLIAQSQYKSSGMANLSTGFLKTVLMYFTKELQHLYNIIIETGIYPDKWKTGTVTPIPKVKNPITCNELRPITILPMPGRILEQILHTQMKVFLESSNYLVEQQNGFRPNKSTTRALATLLDEILTGMDNGQITLTVFIDFRKAFDTVDHQILLEKLSAAGIGNEACILLKSYLSNRKQITNLNNIKSTARDITMGVPQGSTLGPLLFIIYINDIIHVSNEVSYTLFADDIALTTCHKDNKIIENVMNMALKKINTWCAENKLTINTKKTEYVRFGTTRMRAKLDQIKIIIGKEQLVEVESYNYLGTTLDAALNIKPQISKLNQHMASKLITFRRLTKYTSEKTAVLIYKTMLLPIMDYNDIIYGLANQQQTTKIQRVQNQALRIIFQNQKLSVKNMHDKAKIDSLQHRREQHLLMLMRSRVTESKYVQLPRRVTRQNEGIILKVPQPHSNKLIQSPLYNGGTLWNKLPKAIKDANSRLKFKIMIRRSQAGMPLDLEDNDED